MEEAFWDFSQPEIFGNAGRTAFVMSGRMQMAFQICAGTECVTHFVSSSKTETTYSAMAQSSSSVPPPTPMPPAIFPFTNKG